MLKTGWAGNYRLFIGCCVLWAICTQVVANVQMPEFSLIHFLSLFTVQSNLFAACVLIFSAIRMPYKRREKHLLHSVRGAALLYLLITAVYLSSFFISQNELSMISTGWISLTLHWGMPIAFFIDFVIFPPKSWVSSADSILWLIYPVIYVCSSLIQGLITNWYPYAFLNPANDGFFPVVWAIFLLGLGIFPLSQALIWLNNTLQIKMPS